MKLTISQEGCNPITIRTLDKVKSKESFNMNEIIEDMAEDRDKWGEGISKKLESFIVKNKDSIKNQTLSWGLKYAKWYAKINEYVLKDAFGGKDIKSITTNDISKCITYGSIKEATDNDKKKVPSALFAITFEWKVDDEHGAAVVFDDKGKAFRVSQIADCFQSIANWEIKEGLALHK